MKRTDLKKHAAALLLVLCLLVTSALPALATSANIKLVDSSGNPTAVSASKWVLVGKQVNGLSFKDTTGKSGTTYAYTVRGVAADGKTLSPTYNKFGLRITMP